MASIKNQVRQSLFEIAVERGYCNIYSSYEVIEESLQRVVDEVIK